FAVGGLLSTHKTARADNWPSDSDATEADPSDTTDAIEPDEPSTPPDPLAWAFAQLGKPYIWGSAAGRSYFGSNPIGFDCLTAGTLVSTEQGDVPIEHICAGDRVLTRRGYRTVLRAWKVRDNAEVLTLRLPDGRALSGTPDHRI